MAADNKLTVEIKVKAEQAMASIKNFKSQLFGTQANTASTTSAVNTMSEAFGLLGNKIKILNRTALAGFSESLISIKQTLRERNAFNVLEAQRLGKELSIVNAQLKEAKDAVKLFQNQSKLEGFGNWGEGIKSFKSNAEAQVKSLTAEQVKLSNGLEQVSKASDKQVKAMELLESQYFRLGLTLAATIATMGLIATKLTKLSLEMSKVGDQVDDTSQKVLMSYSIYQGWSYIMQICGTDISTINTAMRGLNKAVNSGSEAFQKIGLSMSEVNSMSREDLFAETVKRIQNLNNEADKVGVASSLFGARAYSEMMGVLNASNGEIANLARTYRTLGAVMDDEMVGSSSRVRDALTTMKYAFQGLKASISEGLLEPIVSVVKWLTMLIAKINIVVRAILGLNGTLKKTTKNNIGNQMADGMNDAVQSAEKLKRELLGFDEINRLSDNDTSAAGVDDAFDFSEYDAGSLDIEPLFTNEELAKIEEFRKKVDEVKESLQKWVPILTTISGLGMLIAGVMTGNIPLAVAGAGVLFGGLAIGIQNDFGGAFGNIKERWNDLVEHIKNSSLGKFFSGFFQGFKKEMDELFGGLKDMFSTVGSNFDKLKQNLSTLFGPAIQSLRDFYNNYLKPIVDWIAETFGIKLGSLLGNILTLAINAILSPIVGTINLIIGLINGVSWVLEKAGIGKGKLQKLEYLQLPKLATGGITTGATIAEIGEKGREVVLPLDSNTEWMDKLADRINSKKGSDTYQINVDGKRLFEFVVGENNSTVNRTGKSPLKI